MRDFKYKAGDLLVYRNKRLLKVLGTFEQSRTSTNGYEIEDSTEPTYVDKRWNAFYVELNCKLATKLCVKLYGL